MRGGVLSNWRTFDKWERGIARRLLRLGCGLLAVLMFVSGCTTQTFMPTTEASTQELRITTGDQIRVLTTRRERLTFEVKAVLADRFVGVTSEVGYPKDSRSGGQTIEVPFDELAMVQVTRFDARAAAVATAVAVVTISAVGAVIAAAAVPALPPGAP